MQNAKGWSGPASPDSGDKALGRPPGDVDESIEAGKSAHFIDPLIGVDHFDAPVRALDPLWCQQKYLHAGAGLLRELTGYLYE